jgi:hypothetical protein
MNERIKQLAVQADLLIKKSNGDEFQYGNFDPKFQKFAELIVAECVNREALLGAIARGWCSEKNSHKTMDSDLAMAIFDQVEQQIRQQFGIK